MRASKRSRNRPPAERRAEPERQRLTKVETASSWSGPLPPPEAIAAFNEVADRGGDRIIAEWEAEAAHRREFEQNALAAEIVERRMGRWFGFLFAISALATASWCAYLGHPGAAAAIGSTTIAAVVGAFVYQGRR